MEKIIFTPDGGGAVPFYVLEQTRLGGTDYILVTDSEDEDGEALILRDTSAPEEAEAVYEIVNFTLIFPAIDKDVEAVDFIESDKWNIKKIRLVP